MSVVTLEGIVEHGQIRLISKAQLPEGTYVYIIVPNPQFMGKVRVVSPHLVHKEQAADFVVEMIEENEDV